MLLMRHLVLLEDGVYRSNPQEEALLSFYANAIRHLMAGKPIGLGMVPAATSSVEAVRI
jgi:hypothetical protein